MASHTPQPLAAAPLFQGRREFVETFPETSREIRKKQVFDVGARAAARFKISICDLEQKL